MSDRGSCYDSRGSAHQRGTRGMWECAGLRCEMRQNERILEMQDRGSMTDGFESKMNVGAKCERLNDRIKVKWESSMLLVH